jgi:UPF0716 protein FxsA
MFGRLFLAFTITTAIELVLILVVGRSIGVWITIGVIVVTGLVGAYLASREGRRAWSRVVQSLSQGEPPADPIVQALLVLVGGVLLLTPGFITDTVGFCCLLPFTRSFLSSRLRRYFADRLSGDRLSGGGSFPGVLWSATERERPQEAQDVELDDEEQRPRTVVDVKGQQ